MMKRYWWLNEESQTILSRGYLLDGESVPEAIHRIVSAICHRNPEANYQEIRDAIEYGWLSLSSPIWSNMGTQRGLPVSCFGNSLEDNMLSISNKLSEVIMQTKLGGGTSGYFGKLRKRGAPITNNGESSGAVSFMQLFNTTMNVVSQGSTRRGSFAAYLDIDHPDIEEFLQIKDIGNPIQNLFYGVCVSDDWMRSMKDGDIQKRNLWAKVLQSRQEKGLPYIFFTDTVNKNAPDIYKATGRKITHSNLC